MTKDDRFLECEKRWVFAFLIFVAGFYGAYTMTVRGGVFCNAQTGNMVLFGVALGKGNWSKAVYYLIPMAGYLLGTMVSDFVPRYVRRSRMRWDTLLILIEIVMVVAVGAVPASAPHQICQIAINFVSAMQYNTFRQAEGIAMATTFCTNHMRMFGTALSRGLFRRKKYPDSWERVKAHGVMMLSFTLGVAVSAALCMWVGVRAIWFALIPLVILFVDLLRADLTTEKDKLSVIPRGH